MNLKRMLVIAGVSLVLLVIVVLYTAATMPQLNPFTQYGLVPYGTAVIVVSEPSGYEVPASGQDVVPAQATPVVGGNNGPVASAGGIEYSGSVVGEPEYAPPHSQPVETLPTTSPVVVNLLPTAAPTVAPTVHFIAPTAVAVVPSRQVFCQLPSNYLDPTEHGFPVLSVPGGILVRQYPAADAPGVPVTWKSTLGDPAIRLSEITGWLPIYDNDVLTELFVLVSLNSTSGWVHVELGKVADNGTPPSSASAIMVSELATVLKDLGSRPRYTLDCPAS